MAIEHWMQGLADDIKNGLIDLEDVISDAGHTVADEVTARLHNGAFQVGILRSKLDFFLNSGAQIVQSGEQFRCEWYVGNIAEEYPRDMRATEFYGTPEAALREAIERYEHGER